MRDKGTICICSSADFYRHASDIAKELLTLGFRVEIPITVKKMRRSGNFKASDYRTWLKDANTYHRKTYLMKNHFDKIARSDALLVVNDEKRGIRGYIGTNVLMEMGLGFYLMKPIYMLNKVYDDMPVYEEVRAMNCVVIDNDLSKIKI